MKTKGLNFLEALAANEKFKIKLPGWHESREEVLSFKEARNKEGV
jgi:hypothetical protein